MVIAVSGHNVEGHAEKCLTESLVSEAQLCNCHKELGIGVRPTLPEIEMIHCTERLKMMLARLAGDNIAVKAD
jgi:hypothetical protein